MPRISHIISDSGRDAIVTINDNASWVPDRQLAAFTRWFEGVLAKLYSPILDKPLVVGKNVKTDSIAVSGSVPKDIVTTVTTWGFELTPGLLERLRLEMQVALENYFEAFEVTIQVILNYISPTS